LIGTDREPNGDKKKLEPNFFGEPLASAMAATGRH
jgi:hypothetical protein